MMRRVLTIVLLGVVLAPVARAQIRVQYYDYVRSDLEWYTLETEHFKVHFHADAEGDGSNRTARVVARIAEEVYGPITELYDHEPDTKVSFILKDFEDYSNGAAYFFDNMIEIWAPALDTPLRGDHSWLRNVITHEFTHIIQVQKTMKANRRLPFFYLQYLDYEEVRRPDVLYGFPNILASYPIPVLNNPAWFAEGTAQYQRNGLDYDRWDSHRDMLLRTRILAGEELSLSDMGGFYSHTSLGRESVYNHGFAFSQYLAGTYGEDALRKVSAALSEWPNWNFRQATSDALGERGDAIYASWIDTLRSQYGRAAAMLVGREESGETVTPEGFYNLHPRISPDGSQLAFLSNRGQDFSRQYLYVESTVDGTELLGALDLGPATSTYVCSLGHSHRLAGPTSGPISWHPDGKRIAFSRIRDDQKGHLVSDLYSVDVTSKKIERLTRAARASDPAYAPDGARLAFVTQSDGSTNLAILTGEDVVKLTAFEDGEQIAEPRWSPDGAFIYFGLTTRRGRDIVRIAASGGDIETVRATQADERSPVPSADGAYLYFSADDSGIYNVYRRDLQSGEEVVLSRVLGGAFMPEPTASGDVYFSRFDWDGYHIAHRDVAPVGDLPQYTIPPVFAKAAPSRQSTAFEGLNAFDDRDISAFSPDQLSVAADSLIDLGIEGVLSSYDNTFTSFSFLPVFRLDRYVSRRRSRGDVRLPDRSLAGTLARNAKVGFYTGNREVMNGLSMFGGIMVAPASTDAGSVGNYLSPTNLLKLERDLFLQFEYKKGLGLIPKRWSPQFSLELFNVRRNVSNGLSIEEFACTACFPDTTLADLSYNLWELDFAARGKVSRALLIEAGVRYSPYRVTTERFFSRELKQAIPETSSRYFIGRSLRLKAYYEARVPHRHMDVVEEGLRGEFTLERERGQLLNRFDVDDGILTPIYENDVLLRATLDVRAGSRLRKHLDAPHGISFRVRASALLSGKSDDFYDDYVGGLTGARGYPFYALGGNNTGWFQASYTFPLAHSLRQQVLFLYFDKIYARVYADAATAWNGAFPGLASVRKDVGAEIRFGLGSFYLLPTALFVSGTYGLDSFDFQLDEGFLTPDGSSTVRYGGAFQWHVGILFGFDQL